MNTKYSSPIFLSDSAHALPACHGPLLKKKAFFLYIILWQQIDDENDNTPKISFDILKLIYLKKKKKEKKKRLNRHE